MMLAFNSRALRAARLRMGLSYGQFSRLMREHGAVRCGKGHVWGWEHGVMPRSDYLVAICEVIGAEIGAMIMPKKKTPR